MSRIYTSADQLIGATPLLELSHIEREHRLKARILAKLEYFNPAGSVKDRVALAMIDDIQAGRDIHPTRGPIVAPTFKENERVLAGFLDGHEDEGPSAGRATLLGREIAAAKGWTEPVAVEVADEATDTKGEEAK